MSIKIKPGMAPQFGRITMPRGTYLSNPATAHDGGLGEGGGTDLPPVPQLNLGGNMWGTGTPGYSTQPNLGRNVQGGGGNLTDIVTNYLKQVVALPTPGQVNETFGAGGAGAISTINNILQGVAQPNQQPTGAFKPPTPASPSNGLVGYNLPTSPLTITPQQLQSMFGNLSPQEIANTMRAKGYTTSYVQGIGQLWVKQGESAPTEQLTTANNYAQGQRVEGNPYEIGATLAPGEHVVTAGYVNEAGSIMGRGIGVTGGTPYTNKEGTTVAQYAVSYGGRGDRWKSKISQDTEGNWVKTYYKTFSKARSRSALKKKQGRKERAYAEQKASYAAKEKQAQEQQAASYAENREAQAAANIPTQVGYGQQLVTLRASFG